MIENERSPLATGAGQKQRQRRLWQRPWFKAVAIVVLAACGGLLIAAEYTAHHAEPIIRKRIIETLSASFNSSVELDHVGISLLNGIQVSGDGLRVPFGTQPEEGQARSEPQPLLSVDHFSFRLSPLALLRQPAHVSAVEVQGMELHIPPAQERGALLGAKEGKLNADPTQPTVRPKIAFTVGEVRCVDARLFIETNKLGKEPLEFDIGQLNLRHVGPSRASAYRAVLVIPTPRGVIQTSGHFGPWNSDDPRQTPVDGDFVFSNADMNTIKGLGGTLQGKGHYAGVLERLTVDGTADVPDFSLDTANHPVPLHTRYHALVDGTSGDTFLEPVEAVLGQSSFTTRGKVVKVDHAGHDIALTVDMPGGRIQDLLQLAMKTEPPVMRGTLHMEAKLHIPPGPERVPLKLDLGGQLQIEGVSFNNAKFQDRVDGLSMRAQGKPKQVMEASSDREAEVRSGMAIDFSLAHGVMTVSSLRYQLPGAKVALDGVYSMDGNVFEFRGHVRTEARASQMVTGWRSWLLKPVDPLLEKNGAGVELPIAISGTEGDFHTGLALHGADDTPAQIQEEIGGRQKSDAAHAAARRAAERADREDAEAARAKDLKSAQRLHDRAVTDRKEAQRRLAEAGEPLD